MTPLFLHLLTTHATSASDLRCTACRLAIFGWRCPAFQSLSLVAPRKDSYFNNNPFRGAVRPAAPERLAWLETPLRRVGSLLKGVGQSPLPLAASKSAAIGQCQVGGPPRWEHHHFQVGVPTRWEYHHTVASGSATKNSG